MTNGKLFETTVRCAICDREFPEKQAALAFNIGTGAEYHCSACVAPAKTAEQAVITIKTFIEGSK